MMRCSIPDSVKIFLFSKTTRRTLGLTQHPIPCYRGSLSNGKMVAEWRLNTHLHLLPSVRTSGAIPLHLRGVDGEDFSCSFTNNNLFTLNNFFLYLTSPFPHYFPLALNSFLITNDCRMILVCCCTYCLYLPALKQSSEFSDHCYK
jgi:hypothetical protein